MKRTSLRKVGVLLAALLGVDQLVQHTVLRDGQIFGQWVVPFDPPLFTHWQRKRVADIAAIVAGDEELRRASIFDAELGWCPRPESNDGAYSFDWSGSRLGARPLARAKEPGRKRIVAVGESFTLAAEVATEHSWPFLVGEALGYEVANLGVAGYGLDQAYLRLLRDGLALQPDEIWLGLMPEGLPRITTLFPPVYRHWSSVVAFKPMFRLASDGSLELVPNPAQHLERTLALLGDQDAFLAAVAQHDLWVRRTPAAFAPRGSSWTHWLATSRLALTAMESGGRESSGFLATRGELWHLTVALVRALDERARGVGARLRVIVLPSQPDLIETTRAAAPYWHGLLEELRAAGIDCLDVTSGLLEAGAAEDGRWWMPQAHYAPAANRLVAEEIAAQLSS